MTEIHYHCFRKCILKSAGADRLDEKTEMYIRLYCQGTVALTGEWILGKYGVEQEELVEIYEKALPMPLQQYLYSERE